MWNEGRLIFPGMVGNKTPSLLLKMLTLMVFEVEGNGNRASDPRLGL